MKSCPMIQPAPINLCFKGSLEKMNSIKLNVDALERVCTWVGRDDGHLYFTAPCTSHNICIVLIHFTVTFNSIPRVLRELFYYVYFMASNQKLNILSKVTLQISLAWCFVEFKVKYNWSVGMYMYKTCSISIYCIVINCSIPLYFIQYNISTFLA